MEITPPFLTGDAPLRPSPYALTRYPARFRLLYSPESWRISTPAPVKVLRQAKFPKWRGSFKWQIEAKIEALQAAYARLRAEAAKPDG
jgi:hypothetical protein